MPVLASLSYWVERDLNSDALVQIWHTYPQCALPKAVKLFTRTPLPMHSLPFYPALQFGNFIQNHEFASISSHFALTSSLLIFAASRFNLVRSSLCARRHLLTCVFASLHIPIAFHRNPRAWHSSRMFMTSSQACGELVMH